MSSRLLLGVVQSLSGETAFSRHNQASSTCLTMTPVSFFAGCTGLIPMRRSQKNRGLSSLTRAAVRMGRQSSHVVSAAAPAWRWLSSLRTASSARSPTSLYWGISFNTSIWPILRNLPLLPTPTTVVAMVKDRCEGKTHQPGDFSTTGELTCLTKLHGYDLNRTEQQSRTAS